MTKTKKIICIALTIVLIAGAVFFAIYNKVGKTYNYGKIKDYSKYITIGDVLGLSFEADDSQVAAVTEEDINAKVASNLRALMTDDDKNVTDTTAVIGTYDDTCDCIFWGIADVSGSRNKIHVHESTKSDPYAYYNIVKEELGGRVNRSAAISKTSKKGE